MKQLVGIAKIAALAILLVGGTSSSQDLEKPAVLMRIYWLEKDGVAHARARTQDSCIPSSPFGTQIPRPAEC